MNKIKTYIINLKDSSDRRAYMEKVMSPFGFLDVEFVEAVDGRKMSPEEIETCFNQSKAHRRYGRILRGGEIGCTLSHKLCAQKLLNSNLPYALFLEDDLIWQAADLEGLFQEIGHLLDSKRPIVVLLSGDYWYLHLSRFYREYAIAHVTDAVCTQPYFGRPVYASSIAKLYADYNGPVCVLLIAAFIIAIFVAAILIDQVRKQIWKWVGERSDKPVK